MEILDISNNSISHIEFGAFDNLQSLRFLALQSNFLSALPTDIFMSLPESAAVELYGNPLLCVPPTNNKETNAFMSSYSSTIPACVQTPWFSSGIISRFDHSECNETRTWDDIARTYASAPDMLMTGGLGSLASENFEVWACFRGHACLHRLVPFSYTDVMCYVYHEKEERWLPWALRSEMNSCGPSHNTTYEH
jgi:hypothetical protein